MTLILLWLPFQALANFSPSNPINHFFNSKLLSPGESQISIAGNAIVGVSENLQLGTQIFLLGGKITNFSLKHRMLSSPKSQTSFSGHFFKGKLLDFDLGTGLVGVNHDLQLGSSSNFSLGLYDLFAIGKTVENINIAAHLTSLEFGFDHVFSDQWGTSILAFLPIFANTEIISEAMDQSAEYPYFLGVKSSEGYPAFALITVTRSYKHFNCEAGALWFNPTSNSYLYLNLFWRFS